MKFPKNIDNHCFLSNHHYDYGMDMLNVFPQNNQSYHHTHIKLNINDD